MYRVGNRERTHRKRTVILITLICLILAAIVVSGIRLEKLLRPNTVLTQSAAVVTDVRLATPPTRSFDLGIFTISLPTTWQEVVGETTPYHIYRFEGGIGKPDEEQLEIYQDTIPKNFAVNAVLPVTSDGNRLGPMVMVSDNCADFTKPISGTTAYSGTAAEWAGTNFLCDLSNPERDVVGTSSPSGINTVTLIGSQSGTHTFFFSYTNDSISPDYTNLYNALISFRLK
jgi:hypothetical protein